MAVFSDVFPPFDKWPARILGTAELLVRQSVILADRDVPVEHRAGARGLVQTFAGLCYLTCRAVEMDSAAQQFKFITEDLEEGRLDDDGKLAERLDLAMRSFREDLVERYFFRVEAKKKGYYGADFGPEVTAAFPSAVDDIREANTCYALERYVASVLHLMRAVEVALLALAKERQVKFPRGPLAWQDWQTIISNIASKVDDGAGKWQRGPEKDAFVEFYNGALGEFRAFKDVYRNVTMHTRPKKKLPGETEARDALIAVGGFLRRLSDRLTEKGHRIRWKKP
jgi:hypothetical protein